MNFLAHLLLSGERDGVIMGNYVGDFVKGRLTEEKTRDWNTEYVLGLKLHRHIDFYTDSHPLVLQARHKIAKVHGRLAGIIIDIYFDYFLAINFDDFSTEKLWEYSRRMYAIIEHNQYLIPEIMLPMVKSMIRQDWLNSYATFEGIDLTFNRMSRRTGYLADIRDAVDELKNNQTFYHGIFLKFFPELLVSTTQYLRENLEI